MRDVVARRQGQPVLFLALLLAGWCLLRIVTWENPWPLNSVLSEPFRLTNADLVGERQDSARAARSLGTVSRIAQDVGDRGDRGRMAPLPSAFDPVVRSEVGELTPLATFDENNSCGHRAAMNERCHGCRRAPETSWPGNTARCRLRSAPEAP